MRSLKRSSPVKLLGRVGLTCVLLMPCLVGSEAAFAHAAAHRGQSATRTTVPAVIASAKGNWQLVWNEAFLGPKGSAPSAKNWTYDIGNNNGWGNDEEEYYTDSTKNAFLTGDGGLVVQALKEPMDGYQYTSARLVSKQSWRYGYIEVDAKLPRGGQGVWPAIWLLPTNWTYGGWPESGEIDVEEAINDMSQVHGDLHFGTGNEPDLGVWYPGTITPGFHVYAIKWEPDRIRYYVDGKLYLTFTQAQWTTSVAQSPAPFDQPFHLMINMAMGGNWPGPVAANTPFPQQMEIKWVRVYQRSNAYAWPVPGIVQADKVLNKSVGVEIATTSDIAYDPAVTPAPPDNLNLVLDHKLVFKRVADEAVYRLRVSQTGEYVLSLRVRASGGKVIVQAAGKAVGALALPHAYGQWRTVNMRVRLHAGIEPLQLRFSKVPVQLHWLRIAGA